MTFTNKAAKEMLRRVEVLTGPLARRIWGGTFHATGNKILRQDGKLLGYGSNFSILDEEDQKDLIKVCISEIGIEPKKERFPAAALVRNIISLSFNTQLGVETILDRYYPYFAHLQDEIIRIEDEYRARKKKNNSVDYDDLLGNWLVLLRDFPEILEKYGRKFQHILVDEYQDTNKVQADIVELLASKNGNNLTVVGDDSQSIYAFRGANYDNIIRFPERNPGTEIFKLEINYRSTPQILNFTNDSIRHNKDQYEKVLQSVRKDGFSPALVPVQDAYGEADFVSSRILQIRDEGVPLEEIAVLYRSHYHCAILEAELVRRNIPYEIRDGIRFFDQAHIKDVISYLKILVNPHDETAWRRILLMIPKIGNVTAGRIWNQISNSTNPLKAIQSGRISDVLPSQSLMFWSQFTGDLKKLIEIDKKSDPPALISAILEGGYLDYLRSRYDNYASRTEDIEQLGLFAKQYSELEDFLSELVLLGELQGQDVVSGSDDTEKVILSSIHRAKGLEWQHVFVIRACEGALPADRSLKEENGEEEERRVFYVAATRAKDELYIVYPLIDIGRSSSPSTILQPSRFIQEIDAQLYDIAEIQPAEA